MKRFGLQGFRGNLSHLNSTLKIKYTPTYLFPYSSHALYIPLSFRRLGFCNSFSSLSKWRVSTKGAMDGRPWAHWKGSWQEDKDATRLQHSSLLRLSLNLMAPWQAREASAFSTVRGRVPFTLPVERSNSICSRRYSSTIGLITDGLPRLSSLLSFSMKHSGTFPTKTCGSAACENFTSRPKLCKCAWQDLSSLSSSSVTLISRGGKMFDEHRRLSPGALGSSS